MSSDSRPQYKPTPELQNVLNTLAPKICETLSVPKQPFTLMAYSNYPDNPNKFTLYVDAGVKKYKMEIEQEVGPDQKVHMKVLQMFEIVTK